MKMQWFVTVAISCLFTGLGYTICLQIEKEHDHCVTMMNKVTLDNRETATDNTPFRLHSTWVSEKCEVRAGPKYIIRKYTFFKNDTFLLLQFHYAEESCSIATYNVVARGSIKLLSSSRAVPGATRASIRLDSVHLTPLNRQVANKFSRRMNTSCGGIETKWRPYTARLIYERPIDSFANKSLRMAELNSNSIQSRMPRTRKQRTFGCLESFGIEFTELRLLRVEIRRSSFSIKPSIETDRIPVRIELLLGGLARNVQSQRTEPRPNRLQTVSLVRVDTAIGCPICGSVLRATEYSPPLFHEAPSLPAMIDGLWLSIKCESVDDGFWSRRVFRIYSENNRWVARWTYYADPTCSNSLYTLAAAGVYIQRALREIRNIKNSGVKVFDDDAEVNRLERRLRLKVYRHVLHDEDESNVLRGNRVRAIDRQRFAARAIPFSVQKDFALLAGTTELELQVLESLSIPLGKIASARCRVATSVAREFKRMPWIKNCMPRVIEAPATLTFKAKISLDSNGDYTLFLASWKDDLWDAPLYRCSRTTSGYYFQESWHDYLSFSQNGNWYQPFNRYRQHWISPSFAFSLSIYSSTINWSMLLLLCWSHVFF